MEGKENLITEEDAGKFDFVLNKVIIMSSREYYRKIGLSGTKEVEFIFDEKEEINLHEETFEIKEKNFLEEIDNEKLYYAVKKLSNIEQQVIFLIFYKGLSQKQTAKIIGVCPNSVTKIKKRSIEKIRKIMGETNE